MPRGHSNNVDLSKRLERISKTIKMLEKIQSTESYTFNGAKGDPFSHAVLALREISDDLKTTAQP